MLVCLAIVGLAVGGTIEPRLHHTFPSMVDDWSAIARAPDQLQEVVRLGNPEEQRYRPAFVAWNALQFHTLGAPRSFTGPQVWGLLRLAIVVFGVTLLTLLMVEGGRARVEGRDPRWLLVLGVPLAALTAPTLAIDFARFGPQEPLQVGCMALGAVLLVRALNALLRPADAGAGVIAGAVAGLVLWSFGVLQKETSLCVLLLAPFLLPTLRVARGRLGGLGRRRRLTIGAIGVGVVLPFVPVAARTLGLSLADERVYEDAAAGRAFPERLADQLERVGDSLHTPLPAILFLATVALLALMLVRGAVDWLPIGLLVVAVGFLAFAAGPGVVATRYYLPPLALTAFAFARAAPTAGRLVVTVAGVALIVGGAWQAREARTWVDWWVDGEEKEEAIVREAAARAAGGCEVSVTGLNVERVAALPVLLPLAGEPPRDCAEGERFVVVMDYPASSDAARPDDAVLAACAPETEPVWTSQFGDIFRCTL